MRKGDRAGRLLGAPLPALALVLALSGSGVGCSLDDVRDAQRGPSTRARAISARFETPEPFSPRTLAPGDLAEFLVRYPEYRGDSATVASFYARREMQYAWVVREGMTEQGEVLVALAGLRGGPLDSVDVSCPKCLRDAELRLSAEVVRFARRDYGGYFERNPRELEWHIPRAKIYYTRLLDALADGAPDLRSIEPVHPAYAVLRDAVPRLRTLADLPWDTIGLPAGFGAIVPGDSGEVVRAVRHRLALLGDYRRGAHEGAALDSVLVEGIRRFQRRHGLGPDGAIGAATLDALNISPADRLRTLLLNMERLRWMPERLPPRVLVVNIPEFRLRVLEGDAEVLSMPIVVGTEVTPSVVFADTITSLTFSPTWTVPASIMRKEILPAMRRDRTFLTRNHMEIIGGTAALPVVRQRPGPDNALGSIKFSFPNPYGIFMHDTPARGLFALEQRAFSHGCIRVADAPALARYLLRSDTTWTEARMAQAMRSDRELVVPVREPLPVMMVYFTAWVDRDGLLNFRDDVYGHDARLSAELFATTDTSALPDTSTAR